MQHEWSLEGIHIPESWVTIGTFDGVHLGHQEIIHQLAAGARQAGLPAVAVTFYPHPAVVLGKRSEPYYLTTPDERAGLLNAHGADIVITIPFTPEVAKTSARDFIALLVAHLNMSHLLIGPDFALGRDREGNAARLTELGKEFGYTVEIIPPVELDGQPVSSSRVRAALARGDIQEAARLLGRPYHVSGQVVPGDGRGQSIGIPTANLSLWPDRAIPKSGVYVTHAHVNGRAYGSVTNVGVRPTFNTDSPSPRVETHIFDFNETIYGQDIQVEFLERLRDEIRFPDVRSLVSQIQTDITRAKEILDNRTT